MHKNSSPKLLFFRREETSTAIQYLGRTVGLTNQTCRLTCGSAQSTMMSQLQTLMRPVPNLRLARLAALKKQVCFEINTYCNS